MCGENNLLNDTDSAIGASSDVEEPIRAEVFGGERLEEHAASLAAAVRITEKPTRGRHLLPRVRDNRRALLNAYRSLEVGSHGLPLIGAGDWNDGMNRVGHDGRGVDLTP